MCKIRNQKLVTISSSKKIKANNKTHKVQVTSPIYYLSIHKQSQKRTMATQNSCNQRNLAPANFCNKHNIAISELEIALKKNSSGKTHSKKVAIVVHELVSLSENKRAKKTT